MVKADVSLAHRVYPIPFSAEHINFEYNTSGAPGERERIYLPWNKTKLVWVITSQLSFVPLITFEGR
jgi:hypothetical protein